MGSRLTTVPLDGADLLARAEHALRGVVDDPTRARAEATQVLKEAIAGEAWEVASVAERALGLAQRELLDVAAAQRHLHRSIALAEQAGSAERSGEARLSLAVDLLDAGRPAAALRELGRAGAALGDEHAQVHNQLALVYARLARFDQAVEAASRAASIAEAAGDLSLLARVLGNRGIMQGERGQLDEGEVDLRRALALHQQLGEQLFGLDTQHNLGWLLTRRGRLPEALALLDRAEAGIARLGVPLAALWLDRSAALLAAGLAGEAADVARAAALELGETGRRGEQAEALLSEARGELLAGRWSAAAATAAQARESFVGQDRLAWAALCSAVELRARARTEPASAASVAAVRQAAAALDDHALAEAAADLRLLEAQTLLALGDLEQAAVTLLPLARSRSRTSSARARSWHAASLLATAKGDRPAALRAARRCLYILDEQRDALGALELHGAASVHSREVAQHGLDLAHRPGDLLTWADRVRSTALQRPPAQPPEDPELAVALEQLRTVTQLRQQAALDDEPSTALMRRQLVLEEQVRRRSRQSTVTASVRDPEVSLREVRTLLQGRRLISFFERRERLLAHVVERRRTTVIDCGSTSEAARRLRHFRLSLRLTIGGRSRATALARDAAAVNALLGAALDGDGPVVVVPTAALAAVPWAALPSLRGRDVEVAPTLSLWCRAPVPYNGSGELVVAGPGLPHAEEEAAQVAALRPDATVLAGEGATAEQVLAALDGAHTAHLACHGTWRAENPLFSALLLHDGPLTVHDLARVRRMPQHVVLSACDSGRAGEEAGQELLGLAAVFFTGGTRTLIASVLPVDDAATRSLMADLHRIWASGVEPATALRLAQQQALGEVAIATAQAFVCLTAAAQTLSG